MPLPDVSYVLIDWEVPIIATYRTQTLENGRPVWTDNDVDIMAVMQPLKPEELELKPEGERAWTWLMCHVRNDFKPFYTGQTIVYDNVKYKVKQLLPYQHYGYRVYHVAQDFTDEQ